LEQLHNTNGIGFRASTGFNWAATDEWKCNDCDAKRIPMINVFVVNNQIQIKKPLTNQKNHQSFLIHFLVTQL